MDYFYVKTNSQPTILTISNISKEHKSHQMIFFCDREQIKHLTYEQ